MKVLRTQALSLGHISSVFRQLPNSCPFEGWLRDPTMFASPVWIRHGNPHGELPQAHREVLVEPGAT